MQSKTHEGWFAPTQIFPPDEVAGDEDLAKVPVCAFSYSVPPDGLPLLYSWLSTLKEVLNLGFEDWREVIEGKIQEPPEGPGPHVLGFGSVLPVKGMGRVSIILWSIYHSYVNLRDVIDSCAEVKADFQRLVKGGSKFPQRQTPNPDLGIKGSPS